MESEDLPERIADLARKFSLIPPARGKQFRVEFAKARAAKRRAARKLDNVLNARASAPSTMGREAEGPCVGARGLMRAWSSAGMLNLRSGLDAQAEEKL